jgi:hypothetical protein
MGLGFMAKPKTQIPNPKPSTGSFNLYTAPPPTEVDEVQDPVGAHKARGGEEPRRDVPARSGTSYRI